MSMNTDGSRRWAQLTKQNIGKSIAIVLDGYVYSAPNVNTEITGGNSQITGHFTPEQAKDLANVLKSGKMPAPARIVQEDIVGPSLGQASINAGVFSFIVALILLMIYMCSMYGFIPGMVANGALVLNMFFTMGILSSFQAALTMSGIAGMVLALGMAVDAIVLFFERTKEELRAGKGLSQSIDFTGGRNFKVQFENAVEPEQVRELIASKFGDSNVSVIAIGTDKKTVRISTNYRIEEEGNNVDSEIEAYLYETLKPVLTQNITLETFIDRENHTGGSIVSSQKVGPSIADDIKTSAMWSVVLALIAIGLYILIRFRNIAYSVGSVAALTSDTLMILGAYSLCWGWMPFSLEIDQTFIGAILTAIGYSINDKVVIFDRVREFFGLYPKRDRKQLFNDSLNTTLARTINTSLSTLIVLLCIFILGGDSIRSFAFAMILGVVIGTLSSLFIASPIAYIMMKNKKIVEPAVEVAK